MQADKTRQYLKVKSFAVVCCRDLKSHNVVYQISAQVAKVVIYGQSPVLPNVRQTSYVGWLEEQTRSVGP